MSNASDFVIKNGVLEKYKGKGGNVAVPSDVTSIGERAFSECSRLTSITLPDGVTSIGDSAFMYCSNLTSITLPDSVTSIGGWAFEYCRSLTSITLPDSVTSIGQGAFYHCSNLTSITLPDSVTSIGDSAFRGCEGLADSDGYVIVAKTVWDYFGKDGLIVIPVGVTSIGINAFWECSSSISITLPDGVTSIGDGAFYRCENLTSIMLPDGVTNIGGGAFSYCRNLTSITLPDSVTSIGDEAFSYCRNLTSITLPDSVTSVGDKAFYDCSSLTSITLPEGVTSIGESAFLGCSSLTSITLPEGVTNIGDKAFECCRSLTSITLPEGVTNIGDKAFACCRSLTSITLPEGVTIIGEGLFDTCDNLTKITMPEGITKIGKRAFADCHNLKDIIIPEGVKEIGAECFEGDKKLKTIVLPSTLVKIGKGAFSAGYDGILQIKTIVHGGVERKLQDMTRLMADEDLEIILFDSHGHWKNVSPDKQAELYMTRQSNAMVQCYSRAINSENIDALAGATLVRLNEKSTSKECNAAAALLFAYYNILAQERCISIYEKLKTIKKGKAAVEKIEADKPLMNILCAKESEPVKMTPVEQKIAEYLKAGQQTERSLAVAIKEMYGVEADDLPQLKCKDGTKAPGAVLMWLLQAHEEYYGACNYWPVMSKYEKPGMCSKAAELVALLDEKSLQAALLTLADSCLGYGIRSKCMYVAYPICRYGDESTMAELTGRAPGWSSTRSGMSAPPIPTFMLACYYNSTRAVMLFIDKYGNLEHYGELRGTDADTIRDAYLSETGLDAEGKKTYDLGNQTVTVRLQSDLSFAIEVPNADKMPKSLPKKGADPEKYEAANADFAQLKKDAKRIVKARVQRLKEDFLSGRTRDAASWQKSYTTNPLLKHVAELLVWSQKDKTFTLYPDGTAHTADGKEYILTDSPVAVAHPMEMDFADIAAWQKYFTSHGLKQPFAQVWEPVIKPGTIKTDRYLGCRIPYYRFVNREEYGIYVEDNDFHNDIQISFGGCNAKVERRDWARHQIAMSDEFEITSFAVTKWSRQTNHLVAYLDRICVYPRIMNDDTTIIDVLPSFTLAQIMDFIKVASENNCPNVTALLLEYKNNNFSDFDPMDEFTLE